jgi:hypothetical protein
VSVAPLYPPEANTGKAWGEIDTRDLLWMLDQKEKVQHIATFLCRTPKEIRDRARELGRDHMLIER